MSFTLFNLGLRNLCLAFLLISRRHSTLLIMKFYLVDLTIIVYEVLLINALKLTYAIENSMCPLMVLNLTHHWHVVLHRVLYFDHYYFWYIYIYIYIFFFYLGFTPCKVEKPLRGIELQKKKCKKDYSILEICLERTYS